MVYSVEYRDNKVANIASQDRIGGTFADPYGHYPLKD